MRFQKLLGFCTGVLFCLPAWSNDILILGIQDYNRSPIVVVREYQGLTDYLSRILKQPVRVETVKTSEEYLKKAEAHRFAFMYGPPSMIMQAAKQAGYQPIAKVPGLLSAGFMSLSSTGIAFPEDMKGKRIGFTQKDSMITLLAIAQLKSMNIDPDKYFKHVSYYNDVDGVLSAMKYNLIDIGVANSNLYNAWVGKGYDINLILQGKGMPHLTFAVRNDFPQGMKTNLASALLKAHLDVDAQSYFLYSSFPNFETAKTQDYESMIKLIGI